MITREIHMRLTFGQANWRASISVGAAKVRPAKSAAPREAVVNCMVAGGR